MNKFIKYARWTACLPAGIFGGALIGIGGIGLIDLVFDCTWVTGCIASLALGFIYPLAAYRFGMHVAPDRGELSRNLLLLVNWAFVLLSASDLGQLLASGPPVEPEHTAFIDTWCAGITLTAGGLGGCWRVFYEEDAARESIEPPAGFEWGKSASQCPVTR